MNANARIVRAGTGERLQLGPTVISVKVGSEASSRYFLAEHTIAPGFDGPPPHTHSQMDHLFYVLAGEIRFVVGANEFRTSDGDVAFVPRGIPHSFGNCGKAEARILEFNVPGGFDRYYADLAVAFPPGTPIQPEVVREITSRHDITPD